MMINGYTDNQHTCHQHTHSVTVCLGSLRFATACCLHSSFNLAHTPYYTKDSLRSGDTHCTLACVAHLLLMHIYCMSQFNQWCELLLPCCPQVQYKIAQGIANGIRNCANAEVMHIPKICTTCSNMQDHQLKALPDM